MIKMKIHEMLSGKALIFQLYYLRNRYPHVGSLARLLNAPNWGDNEEAVHIRKVFLSTE